jgi:AraC-like DNA-binding protein/quercetin dioxygenase-like cupin family protein
MSGQPVTSAFLNFVLQRTRVKTNVCSRQKTEQGYKLQRRTVPDYNFIWIDRGRAVWVVEETPHELSVGDLIIVPPGVEHYAYSTTRRMTLGSIHVEPTLPGGKSVFELLVPPRVRHVKRGSKLAQYLRAALNEWDRDDHGQTMLMLVNWATLVTLELLRYDADRGTLRQRPIDPLIAEMLDELNRRLDRPTDLDDLARWSGFSAQHLNRTFRRLLGVTPLQYLARMRMENAAALLGDGRWTVRAIAAKCGFEDQYYFSRAFKRHFGRSPSQHRDAAGSENPS